MTTIRKFKWIWAWDDEKEEAWLREMANQGLHLKSVNGPGIYTFEQGSPRDVAYRLDYPDTNKDYENYLQLFRDSGWEHVSQISGWQYFRKDVVDGEAPEIFSDNESKAKKYQRIMFLLVLLLPIFIVDLNILSKRSGTFMRILSFAMVFFLIFFSYAIIRLWRRIEELKKKL
jgi:hypothetical protein